MNLKKRLTVVTQWLLYLGTYHVTNTFESHHNCELYKIVYRKKKIGQYKIWNTSIPGNGQ